MKWHVYTTEWRDRFSEFKKAPVFYRWAMVLSLIILLATFALLFLRLAPLFEPGQSIPLHYNIYFGIDCSLLVEPFLLNWFFSSPFYLLF